ncbi:MAG: hypothetical protein ACXVQQ_04625 [Gaiellaceae bacterium]
MRKTTRLVLAGTTALAGLAFAGSALASYGPKLIVSSTDVGGDVRIGVVVPNTDDPTAKVSIYIPASYTVAAAAPGKLGNVTATAAAADLGGAVLPLTGELDAVTPDATTAAAAQLCGVTPSQTWNLQLTAAGQTLNIPMFVVPTAGPEQSAGATKLVVCLPPPDVPAGTPGRATFGAKLLSATFTSSAIKEPTAAGDNRWTSLWTPYTPGAGTPNAGGSVEAQSIRHLPVILHFNSTRKRIVTHKTVKVNGKKKLVTVIVTQVKWKTNVTENGQPAAKATVLVAYKGKKLGGATGTFTLKGVKSAKLTVAALVNGDTGAVPTGQTTSVDDLFYHDLGASACTASPIFQGLPCIDATLGGEFLGGTVTIKAYTK